MAYDPCPGWSMHAWPRRHRHGKCSWGDGSQLRTRDLHGAFTHDLVRPTTAMYMGMYMWGVLSGFGHTRLHKSRWY